MTQLGTHGRIAVLGLGVVGVLTGCPYGGRRTTSAPATPTPVAGLNTEYDEFNAAAPASWKTLVFSTNQTTRGGTLEVAQARVDWSRNPTMLSESVTPFDASVSSPANERGPLLLEHGQWSASGNALVFASDVAPAEQPAQFDLYAVTNCYEGSGCDGELTSLVHLNSPANDLYLTAPFAPGRALFASDRGGAGYDLYEVRWADGAAMSDAPEQIGVVPSLSSSADDHAPYVAQLDGFPTTVVFASDRAGGQGGMDLYCATFSDGTWSLPRPLPHNSASDEFRPSVFRAADKNFLLFSSDRPGGKGGFDLYAVEYRGCR